MEDYTNKYKGEQIEVALFGGEYQEGVLTAYCSIEEVPHIELNGHILSRCKTSRRSTARAGAMRRSRTGPRAGSASDDRDGLDEPDD